MYIIFEGLDNSGKTTAISKLKYKFKDRNVSIYRFPDRTTLLGNEISSLLKGSYPGSQNKLYELCKKQLIDYTENILTKHKPEDIVIIDRYMCSNYAYSDDSIGSIHIADVIAMYELLQNNSPVVTIYLDIPPYISIRRGSPDKEYYDSRDKQMVVYSKYQHIFNVIDFNVKILNVCGLSDINVVNNIIYNSVVKQLNIE